MGQALPLCQLLMPVYVPCLAAVVACQGLVLDGLITSGTLLIIITMIYRCSSWLLGTY